jgi:hypothetical protein
MSADLESPHFPIRARASAPPQIASRRSRATARPGAPAGASDNSPGRKPCGPGPEARQRCKGVRQRFVPGVRSPAVKRFFRPYKARHHTRLVPWLALASPGRFS